MNESLWEFSLDRLYAGEKVLCPTCNKGFFEPSNRELPLELNHCFLCNNCGERLNIDPDVIIT